MSWNTLTDQIYSLIDNNKDTLKIQEVSKHPKLSFDGYPAVTITPSNNENDFETNTDNQRIYVWHVRVFEETKKSKISGALDSLLPIVDSLMDLIDQENDAVSRTVGINLPTRYLFINLLATPGAWFSTEDESIIYFQFTVMAKVSVDVV